MKVIIVFLLCTCLVVLLVLYQGDTSSKDQDQGLTVKGCTVPRMHNYDENATADDGSCIHYPPPPTTNNPINVPEEEEATILFTISSNEKVEVGISKFKYIHNIHTKGVFSHTDSIGGRVYCRRIEDENTNPTALAVIYLNSNDELMLYMIGFAPVAYDSLKWIVYGEAAAVDIEADYWRFSVSETVQFGSHSIDRVNFVHNVVVATGHASQRVYWHTDPIHGIIYCWSKKDKSTITMADNGDIIWTVKSDVNFLNKPNGYVQNVSEFVSFVHSSSSTLDDDTAFLSEDLTYWNSVFG